MTLKGQDCSIVAVAVSLPASAHHGEKDMLAAGRREIMLTNNFQQKY